MTRLAIALAIVLVSAASTATAQPKTSSFAELHDFLSIGETVVVTNQTGKTVKGRVLEVSETVLVLRSGQSDLRLAAAEVRRIARRGHSMRNGAIIGLLAGFAAGASLAAAQPCDFTCFSSAGGILAWGSLGGAIGTGAGLAVAATLRREDVVFEQAATGETVAITPSLPSPGVFMRIAW